MVQSLGKKGCISLPKTKKFDCVLVLNFGGQYCHLLARTIRKLGVYSEIVPYDITIDSIIRLGKKFNIKGFILSGGPRSVYEEGAPKINKEVLDLDIPILGLCYGHQLIANLFNCQVKRGEKREYGPVTVIIKTFTDIFENLNREEKVWMSHYDTVHTISKDFEVLAYSENCTIAAFRHKNRSIYGLQWHPEVTHTEHGTMMLRNFVLNICKCEANWKPASLIKQIIKNVTRRIGTKKAIIALSGGIDSTTATIIASKAINKKLTAVFVDHGFMREGEPEFVKKIFLKLGVNILVINAQERFFNKLRGIRDPEKKRKIIGEEFIRVFEEIADKTGSEYLIQGTIYPDRIESGVLEHSEKIKSHHNVAGIPTKTKFKAIIEPLKDLYKDEVRKIAKSLSVPNVLVSRQPFPGPGLAVRIMGEVTPNRANLLRKADKILVEVIEQNKGLTRKLWQYFAILLNVKSTGVKGDTGAYGFILAIRAVESREAMTANFARIPYDTLEKISTRITNELPEISRVVYDITHKPPATIEWE